VERSPLPYRVAEHEITIVDQLRRPADREMKQGIGHAVTPLFAAIIS